MFDKLLLKTYLYILFILSNHIKDLPENLHTLKDFLSLFVTPSLNSVGIRDLLNQIENHFHIHVDIDKKIQFETINVDNKILMNALSFIIKPIERDVFSICYGETQEGGFLIPNLTFISSLNLEKVSKFILLNSFMPIETDLINDQWIRATNGGKIQIKDNRIIFRLAGLKLPERKNDILKEVVPDFYSKSPDEIESFIGSNLSRWDLSKIIEVHFVFKSIWDITKAFIERNKKVEINIDSFLPVFVLPELIFSSAILCAISPFFICSSPKAGIIDISYDRKGRNLSIKNVLKSDAPLEYPDNANNILKYLIEQLNGKFISETKQIKNEYIFSIDIYIPDKIGIYLDNELSGWDCLSSESKDLLRRLSSDFSIPYENPFISELLRYEVENQFNGILSLPLFINLAHEVLEKKQKSINSTLKSILIDIEKDKLKKKSLNPVIVGQIIESFLNVPDGEQRISKLFGRDSIYNIKLSELSQALKQFPNSNKQLLHLLVSFLQKQKE